MAIKVFCLVFVVVVSGGGGGGTCVVACALSPNTASYLPQNVSCQASSMKAWTWWSSKEGTDQLSSCKYSWKISY